MKAIYNQTGCMLSYVKMSINVTVFHKGICFIVIYMSIFRRIIPVRFMFMKMVLWWVISVVSIVQFEKRFFNIFWIPTKIPKSSLERIIDSTLCIKIYITLSYSVFNNMERVRWSLFVQWLRIVINFFFWARAIKASFKKLLKKLGKIVIMSKRIRCTIHHFP